MTYKPLEERMNMNEYVFRCPEGHRIDAPVADEFNCPICDREMFCQNCATIVTKGEFRPIIVTPQQLEAIDPERFPVHYCGDFGVYQLCPYCEQQPLVRRRRSFWYGLSAFVQDGGSVRKASLNSGMKVRYYGYLIDRDEGEDFATVMLLHRDDFGTLSNGVEFEKWICMTNEGKKTLTFVRPIYAKVIVE